MNCLFCSEEIEKSLVHEGENWKVILNIYQNYLGRQLMILKRHAEDVFELSKEEREELWELTERTVKILTKLFKPDMFNYAIFGNDIRHLHVHVIPRYKSERTFEGKKFVDNNWGKNYSPYAKERLPPEMFEKLRILVKSEFGE